MSRFEFIRAIEQLNDCDEVCSDCTFEGTNCYACDIYYDRKKVMNRLKELGESIDERK